MATVVLRFKTEYAMDHFLGQLSDGWGENHVDLAWDRDHPMGATPIDVAVMSDFGGKVHEIVDEDSDVQAQRMKRFRGSPSGSVKP